MKAILDEMLAALSRGERVVLCSILASSGSVPRGAGAKMAVFEDDRVLGTIGGGAVERLSIQRAQDALKNGGSNELKSYNLHPSEVASTGMICGGAVTVYFQFFAPEQTADVAVLKRWREMLDKDVDLWLLLSLDGDGVNEFHVVTREEIPQDKVDYFSAKAVWKDGIYVEPLCHAGSVYIFGGGHVGRALVPVLATVGFRVVMYDNREELAKKENYPMASEVIFGSFSDISGHWAENEIERAAAFGWISGYPDGTFHPDARITRAEAMTMINRVLCRMPQSESDLLDSMVTWPDNKPSDWHYLAVQEATNSHDFNRQGEVGESWTKLTSVPDWTRYQ